MWFSLVLLYIFDWLCKHVCLSVCEERQEFLREPLRIFLHVKKEKELKNEWKKENNKKKKPANHSPTYFCVWLKMFLHALKRKNRREKHAHSLL